MEESCRCQVYLSSNGFQTFWQTVSLQNTLRQTRSLGCSRREQSPVCRLMWVRTDLTLGLASRTTSLPKCQQAEARGKETMDVTSHRNSLEGEYTRTSCVHADVKHTTVAKGEETPWNQEAESLLPVPFPDKTSSQQTGEKVVGSGAVITERAICIDLEQRALNC